MSFKISSCCLSPGASFIFASLFKNRYVFHFVMIILLLRFFAGAKVLKKIKASARQTNYSLVVSV